MFLAEYSRPPSLPFLRLLRNTTAYHSLSASSGRLSSSQLNAFGYGVTEYSSVTGRKACKALCNCNESGSISGNLFSRSMCP